mgnify:FL=1
MKNIAIFASGSGTNAENLIRTFAQTDIFVTRVYCNNPKAKVIERAQNLNVPVTVFSKEDFYESSMIYDLLRKEQVEFIVLAGFMLFIPSNILSAFDNKILNIHPSLLPKYGGKGMFGIHVHEAVIANKEGKSGITIHLVNEFFDSGEIVFQKECLVLPNDTPEVLAQRVHQLEYEYYPQVVRNILGKCK